MINWYNNSLKTYGEGDFRSLTWGDKEGSSAKIRYDIMNQIGKFKDKSIIEFGCGWGSFFDFGYDCKIYKGIDINKNFINLAQKKYPNLDFKTRDVLYYKDSFKYDLAISSGVAGNQGGPADHPDKLRRFLKNLYNHSQMAIINFPSTWATIRSVNIEYFSPSSTLEMALSITNNVRLIHKSKFDFILVLE
jgi:trans-aconitate methyltransferase